MKLGIVRLQTDHELRLRGKYAIIDEHGNVIGPPYNSFKNIDKAYKVLWGVINAGYKIVKVEE